jgi:hypothetical protein
MRYSDPAAPNGYDGSRSQIGCMTLQDLLHEIDPSLHGNVGKTNQAAMPFPLKEDQIPEILVHADKNPSFGSRPHENRDIAGIRAALAGFQDVMAQAAQPIGEAPTGAPIDEELHEPVTCTASRESCAITAWA